MCRRKPQITYKSPTAEDNVFITIPSPRPSRRPPSETGSSTPSSSRTVHSPGLHDANRRKYPASPSLPLFHPLGHLAMSLPPLDPSEYGLPVPLVSDDIRHNQSGRLKRPAVKPREIEEISLGSATVSTIAVVAARETKERASPRKRRPGGAKRKRKDADDGDAAYPAKRVRVPRGAVGQTAEEDSSLDLMPNNDLGAPIPEVLSDPTDTSKRRSTRATGSLKRRDSSASETTSISANAINAEIATKPDALSPSNADIASKSLDLDPPIGNQEKEEGELSEGLNS